ncbi:MAG: DUF86 domain-containing protein [Thermoanaerobaculaceae bacterium]|nr:DUF86 domain-containing protein [Thermoanaerobaculaceae bacterium]
MTSSEKIMSLVENKPFDKFVQDWVIVDATIRNLLIIGEAVKNLPDEIKIKYSFVEWKKIAGLRDILIHEYFGVNYNILWDIVKNKIPELKVQITKIVDELKNKK